MEKHILLAKKRTILGRKVKVLRKKGIIPANIYGKKVVSVSIEVPLSDFEKVYKKAGVTGLIELTVDGKVYPVLVHKIQYDPVKVAPIHADFYQVDLKEKVAAKVPVVLVGEAPAVLEKVGVLLTLLDEIEVEALPTDLPEKIEVDVKVLAAVDQSIKVADLKVSKVVTLLTPGDRDIVKVAPLVSKEAEKQAAEEEAAKAAAVAAAAPAEGVVPTVETVAPTEAKKEEKGPPPETPKK